MRPRQMRMIARPGMVFVSGKGGGTGKRQEDSREGDSQSRKRPASLTQKDDQAGSHDSLQSFVKPDADRDDLLEHAGWQRTSEHPVWNPRFSPEGNPQTAEADGQPEGDRDPRDAHRTQKRQAEQDHNHEQPASLQDLHHLSDRQTLTVSDDENPSQSVRDSFLHKFG